MMDFAKKKRANYFFAGKYAYSQKQMHYPFGSELNKCIFRCRLERGIFKRAAGLVNFAAELVTFTAKLLCLWM